MPSRKHALVQNPADQHTIPVNSIKHDMFLMLYPSVSALNRLARSRCLWRSCDAPETILQTSNVTIGLLRTPCVYGVVGNIHHVESRQLRQPVFGHA